jgi:pimeloyl-ACP methyl ester carboxylesterase
MIKGLVLFHSHAAADSPETKENRDRTIRFVRVSHHDFLRQFIPDLFAPEHAEKHHHQIEILQRRAALLTPQAIIASLEGMKQRPGYLDALANLQVPVYFILGKLDSRIPFRMVLQQAEVPAHAEVLLLGHVGHMGFFEARDITLNAIRAFARRFA